MKKALSISTVLILLLAFVQVAQAAPKVIAAKFHADWCGSCKTIAPAHEEVTTQYSQDDVLFVTLDKTDESTSNQAKLLAAALGINEIFAANEKTGFVLLIDQQTKEVKGKLTKTHTSDQMAKMIQGVLDGKNMME